MKKIITLFTFSLLFSVAGLADIRLPDTPKPTPATKTKSIDTRLTIKITKDAKEAKLIIPKSQLKELRAELDELDSGSDNTALSNFSRTQTIVSGLFMSLAMVFGGVWFVRSRKIDTKSAKVLVIGTMLFSTFAAATMVFANAGPPMETRSITNKIFSETLNTGWGQASGKIKLEVSDKVSEPQLIVPDTKDEKKSDDE
jgi:hypothetical protein